MAASRQSAPQPPIAAAAADDRARQIAAGDRVLLIIEDDEAFGRTVLDMVREHGFRGVVARSGAQGLEFARTLQPHAITLDLRLPDMDGWVVLDQLKHTPATRHIPVHVISAADDFSRGLERGAIAVLQKPVPPDALESALSTIERFLARRVRRLLVVEDDAAQRNSIVELIGSDDSDVQTTAVDSGEAALEALAQHEFDCMVLDLKLPGISGVELIKRVRERGSGSARRSSSTRARS